MSAIAIVATAMLSVVQLAIGTIVVGYTGWRTRAPRRQARARAFGDDNGTRDDREPGLARYPGDRWKIGR